MLKSLPSLPRDNAESNPLNDVPEPVKKQLLSLQVLFPNEFLPALDLLDRRLVTRFLISIADPSNPKITTTAHLDVQMQDSSEPVLNADESPNTHPPLPQPAPDDSNTTHYVRSAQQRSSRFGTSYDSTTSYEVRLRAWNCTCPAFAFTAFPAVHPEPALPVLVHADGELHDGLSNEALEAETKEWMFGGVSLGEGMPPVCKHLLACVLAERCKGVFGDFVEERRVGVETAAGWAAGWGDS